MTKKHFIELADTLREIRGSARNSQSVLRCIMRRSPVDAIDYIADQLADFCQSQNSKFDRKRWLAYIAGDCGPNGGKVAKS